MAEQRLIFTYDVNELVEMLIKKQDIHEGLWALYIEFGFGVTNVPMPPDGKNFQPAVINVVNRIGIQKQDSPTNLTVDARQVNPSIASGSETKLPIEDHH
jgi:hypothetical protein